MLTLLRQRNFGLLWCGGLISFIGDWVLFVSLPLYILELTKSVVAMGIVFMGLIQWLEGRVAPWLRREQ